MSLNSSIKRRNTLRQTYNDLLERMTKAFLALRKMDWHAKSLHHIQQLKMKELWDNEKDEAWEHA